MMYSPSTRWKTTFSDGRKSATGFAFTKTRDEHAEPPNPLSRFTVTTPSFSLGFGNDASDQLWFQQPDNDLEITVIGTADKRIIDDWPPPLTKRACPIRSMPRPAPTKMGSRLPAIPFRVVHGHPFLARALRQANTTGTARSAHSRCPQ
jgi:hypothetical protein